MKNQSILRVLGILSLVVFATVNFVAEAKPTGGRAGVPPTPTRVGTPGTTPTSGTGRVAPGAGAAPTTPGQGAPVTTTPPQQTPPQITTTTQAPTVLPGAPTLPCSLKVLQDFLLREIMPFSQNVINWLNENRNRMTQEQIDWINARIRHYMPQQMSMFQQGQAGGQAQQPEFSFGGVAGGVQTLAGQGWEKAKGAWQGATGAVSKAYQSTLGEYGSTMGAGVHYGLPAVAAAAGLGVAGLVAAAATAPLTAPVAVALGAAAASGVGTGILTRALDRLNFMYESGGSASSAAAIAKDEARLLNQYLNNQVAYPYPAIKFLALQDPYELYSTEGDKFGLEKKVHELLMKKYQNEPLDAQSQNNQTEVLQFIDELRNKWHYASNSIDPVAHYNYATALEQEGRINRLRAILSEYYRAKNKGDNLAARLQAQQAAAQMMTPLAPQGGVPAGAPGIPGNQ